MKSHLALFLFFACAACDAGAPPAPTAAQQAQLDEAEAMLNEQAARPGAPDPTANAAAPAPDGPGL